MFQAVDAREKLRAHGESPCTPIAALRRPISGATDGRRGRIYKIWPALRGRSAKTGISTLERPYGSRARCRASTPVCSGGEEPLGRQCRTSPGSPEGGGEDVIARTVRRGTRTASDELTRANADSANAVSGCAAQRRPRRGSTAGADRLYAGARPGLNGGPYGSAALSSSCPSVLGLRQRHCTETPPRVEELENSRECYA